MKRDDIIKALRRFKEGNQQRYLIEKIGIFGSSARGDMNAESDIDVVVVLEKQDLLKSHRHQAGFGRAIRRTCRYCELPGKNERLSQTQD